MTLKREFEAVALDLKGGRSTVHKRYLGLESGSAESGSTRKLIIYLSNTTPFQHPQTRGDSDEKQKVLQEALHHGFGPFLAALLATERLFRSRQQHSHSQLRETTGNPQIRREHQEPNTQNERHGRGGCGTMPSELVGREGRGKEGRKEGGKKGRKNGRKEG